MPSNVYRPGEICSLHSRLAKGRGSGNSTASCVDGKDLQPERFEQRHAHDVLPLIAHFQVFGKNALQFESKPAVNIEVAHVDVARVRCKPCLG